MDRPVDQLDVADRQAPTTPQTGTSISKPVSWRDLSANINHTTELTAADQRLADQIQDGLIEPLTTDTGALSATLIGVPQLKVDDLVYPHQCDRLEESTRFCALFDVENTGNVPINWTSTQTKFIGTDDYTYKRSYVSLDPANLGPGCHPSHVEIEPKCRARIITPVEKLPSGVGVSQVVHRVRFHGQRGSQRLAYSL